VSGAEMGRRNRARERSYRLPMPVSVLGMRDG